MIHFIGYFLGILLTGLWIVFSCIWASERYTSESNVVRYYPEEDERRELTIIGKILIAPGFILFFVVTWLVVVGPRIVEKLVYTGENGDS